MDKHEYSAPTPEIPVTKICTKCDTEKMLDEFWRFIWGRLGRHAACIECTKEERLKKRDARRLARAKLRPVAPEGMKICSQCSTPKSFEEFPVWKRSKDGYASSCHACRKIYYENNKARINQRKKDSRKANPGPSKERDRIYHQEHREERLAYLEEWKKRHPHYWVVAYHRDPEAYRHRNSEYRARKKNAPIRDFTRKQWEFLKKLFDYRCVYCGNKPKRLTKDHITPLSHGGAHTMSNIVPACFSCNSRKGNRAPLKPVQPALGLSFG